jgi:hypothetical protein
MRLIREILGGVLVEHRVQDLISEVGGIVNVTPDLI